MATDSHNNSIPSAYVDEDGHLIILQAGNTVYEFSIVDGHLILTDKYMPTYDQLVARANTIRKAVIDESITAPQLGQLLIDMINFITKWADAENTSAAAQLTTLNASLKDLSFSAQSGKISVSLTKNDGSVVTRNIPAASSSASGLMTSAQYDQLSSLVSQYTSLVSSLNGKQDKLTAGTGISIVGNTISAEGARKIILHSSTCTIFEAANYWRLVKTVDNLTFNEGDVGYVVLVNGSQRVVQKLTFTSDGTDYFIANTSYIEISKSYLESLLPGYISGDIIFDARRKENFFLLIAKSNTTTRGTISPYQSTCKAGSTVVLQATPVSGYSLHDISWIGADGETKSIEATSNRVSFVMPLHDTTVTANFLAHGNTLRFSTLEHVSNIQIIVGSTVYSSISAFQSAVQYIATGERISMNVNFEDGYQLYYCQIYGSQSGEYDSPTVSGNHMEFTIREDVVISIYSTSEFTPTGTHIISAPAEANISFGDVVFNNQGYTFEVDSSRSYYATALPGYKITSWELLEFGVGYSHPAYTAGSPLTVSGVGRYLITVLVEEDSSSSGGTGESGGSSSTPSTNPEDWGTFKLGLRITDVVTQYTVTQNGKTKTLTSADVAEGTSYAYIMIEKDKDISIIATTSDNSTVRDWATQGIWYVVASDTNTFILSTSFLSQRNAVSIYPNF